MRFTWPPVAITSTGVGVQGRIEACRETEQNMKNIIFHVNIYARAAKIVECLVNHSYDATQPIKCVYYILLKINKSPTESPAYNNSHDPPLGRCLGLIDKSLVAEMTGCVFKSVTICCDPMHDITFNPNYNVVLVPLPNQTVTLQ